MVELKNCDNQNYVKLAVIGVGGGGNNAINRMIESGVDYVDYIAVNTDSQVLEDSSASMVIQIGKKLTSGLGAGANPEIGEKSANEDLEEIEDVIKDYKIVFVTCGMGGGTGSGAAPIIAKCCKEKGILTVGIVTKPFEYEGEPRRIVSEQAIEKLKENVDTLIIIPNDKLLDIYGDLTFDDAFKKADEILNYVVFGITNIIVNKGTINLDFNDICTVLKDKGMAHLGIGTSKGSDSVMDALNKALNSPLLETTIEGASHILFNVEGKANIRELSAASKTIKEIAGENVNILWGTVGANRDTEDITVTVIATGINEKSKYKDNNKDSNTDKKRESNKKNEDLFVYEPRPIEVRTPVLQVPSFVSRNRRK